MAAPSAIAFRLGTAKIKDVYEFPTLTVDNLDLTIALFLKKKIDDLKFLHSIIQVKFPVCPEIEDSAGITFIKTSATISDETWKEELQSKLAAVLSLEESLLLENCLGLNPIAADDHKMEAPPSGWQRLLNVFSKKKNRN